MVKASAAGYALVAYLAVALLGVVWLPKVRAGVTTASVAAAVYALLPWRPCAHFEQIAQLLAAFNFSAYTKFCGKCMQSASWGRGTGLTVKLKCDLYLHLHHHHHHPFFLLLEN
jgi:hypothetical protein